jgi:hypothetical protein
MTEFDPYQQWLGIPPEDQPPDHYRLLGLRRFESDPATIRSATDERMAQIRVYQIGPRAPYTQQLLNQLAAAKLCLLDPYAKSEYDATLAVETLGTSHVADQLLPTTVGEQELAPGHGDLPVAVPWTAQVAAPAAPSTPHALPLPTPAPVLTSAPKTGEYDPLFLGWWVPLLAVVGVMIFGLGFWAARVFLNRPSAEPQAVASVQGHSATSGTNGSPTIVNGDSPDSVVDPRRIQQEETGFLVFTLSQAELQGQVTLDARAIGEFLVGWRTEDDTASWNFLVKKLPSLGSFRVLVEYQASADADGAQFVLMSDGQESVRDIKGLNRIITDEFYFAVKRAGAGTLQFSLRNLPSSATFALKRIEFSIPARGTSS